MALTIKQLNGDASFLLTFEPIEPHLPTESSSLEPFRVLINPCLAHPARTSDPERSSPPRGQDSSTSVAHLPGPDLIIISNSRNDHCDEAALRQYASGGGKPMIIAEPSAAKTIHSWRYFDEGKVVTLRRWQDPRQTGQNNVIRLPIPARVIAGAEGLVTVALIAQKRDRKGLRPAIGITYTPAPSGRSVSKRPTSTIVSAPSNAPSARRNSSAPLSTLEFPALPPLPSFRPLAPAAKAIPRSIRAVRSLASLSPHAKNRGVSVIFSPQGISYEGIEPYATSHLLAEAALPLTALLQCFDSVSRPWWMGGNNTNGFEDGQEIIAKLGARAWINTSNGEMNTFKLAKKFIRLKKYDRDEVRQMLQSAAETAASSEPKAGPTHNKKNKVHRPTEVLELGVGEDVTLTSEGIWAPEPPLLEEPRHLSIRHVPADLSRPPGSMAAHPLGQFRPTAVAG